VVTSMFTMYAYVYVYIKTLKLPHGFSQALLCIFRFIFLCIHVYIKTTPGLSSRKRQAVLHFDGHWMPPSSHLLHVYMYICMYTCVYMYHMVYVYMSCVYMYILYRVFYVYVLYKLCNKQYVMYTFCTNIVMNSMLYVRIVQIL
jgi:hypothetical protein